MNGLSRNNINNNADTKLVPVPFTKRRGLQSCIAAVSGLALSALSNVAVGLGLGEMQPRSYLGEPLKATIELVNFVGEVDLDRLVVRQVSASQAKRMGVDSFYTSDHLAFSVAPGGGGYHVTIESREPVREPYINLFIELRWPTGVVYREYPVLLDLPPRVPSQSQVEPRPTADPVEPRRQTSRTPRAPRLRTDGLATTTEGTYQVQSGDTLSKIANRWREGTDQSLAEISRWLLENNPEAFIGGDMNRLLAGAVLQMPGVVEQRASARAQPASRGGRLAPVGAAQAGDEAGVAVERAETAVDGATQETVSGLLTVGTDNRDDNARELIDMLVRENQSLTARIEQLEDSEYLTTLKELISLQRQQITDLRAQLGIKDDSISAEIDGLLAQVSTPDSSLEPLPSTTSESALSHDGVRDSSVTAAEEPRAEGALVNIDTVPPVVGLETEEQSSWWRWLMLAIGTGVAGVFVAMFAYYRKLVSEDSADREDYLPKVAQSQTQPFIADEFSDRQVINYDGELPTAPNLDPLERGQWALDTVTSEFLDKADQELLGDLQEDFEDFELDDDAFASEIGEKSLEAITQEISKEKEPRRPDNEVRLSIAEKMAQYNPDEYREELASLGILEIDEIMDLDAADKDDIDEIVYRATMFCEFKKFSKARQLVEAKMASVNDSRLVDALNQIDRLQLKSANS